MRAEYLEGSGPMRVEHSGLTQEETLVSQGEVENVSVGDSVEAGEPQDAVDDESVASDPGTEYQTVDDGRQNQHKGGHRDTISFPTVSLVQTVTGVGTEIELFLHFQWDVCQVHLVLLFSVVK